MRSNTYVRAFVAAVCLALPLVVSAPSMAASPTGWHQLRRCHGREHRDCQDVCQPAGESDLRAPGVRDRFVGLLHQLRRRAGGKNVSPSQVVGSGTNSLQVTFELSGLSGGSRVLHSSSSRATASTPTTIYFYGTFFAGNPDAFTDDAHSTNATTVNITGQVDANGQATTVNVRYDTSASVFCQNNGQGGSPKTSAASVSGGAANGFVDVSINLTTSETGVSTGASLCVMLVASNVSGASQPSGTFPVVVGAPEVRDQDARGKSPTSVAPERADLDRESGHDRPRRVRRRRLGFLRQRRGSRALTARRPTR